MRARTAVIADVASVIGFVAIGRASHEDGLACVGTLLALLPFAVGLAAGWAVARAWRRPGSLASGATIWAVTVAGGVLLRGALPGRGIEPSFVVVTALSLGLLLIGWRALVAFAARSRPARSTP